jgi:hypothetical protein
LVELPVAARLRALVPEEGPRVPELHGLGPLLHAVLEIRPADRRRPLRAQRQAAAALVLEGEHLLLDDVGGLADPSGEELGVLEGRRVDPAVAGALEHLTRELLDPRTQRLLLGQHVEGPTRGLELLVHEASLIGFAIRSRPQAGAPHKSLRASPFAPKWSGLEAA